MEARPEAKVVWRQGVREVGGQEVPGRRVVTDGRESELVLDIVKTEELGSYTCAAKNSLGEASALLVLPGDTYFLTYNTATTSQASKLCLFEATTDRVNQSQ